MIPKILLKKLRSVYPVVMEGMTLRRTGKNLKTFAIWLDRKIGMGARWLVMPWWKTDSHKITFIPYQHTIACNPKYISDELIRNLVRSGREDITIYWSVNKAQYAKMNPDTIAAVWTDGELDKESPEYIELKEWILRHVRFVRPNSYQYFCAAGTSRVIVINSLLGDKFYPFPVRKDQIVLETWHGSLGIKRFDLAHYNTNYSWPVAAVRTGHQTTHCITNSDFEEAVFAETFWDGKPMLRLGHARNDIFFPAYEGLRTFLRMRFLKNRKLPEDTRFVLYAPTFRDDHDFNVYDLSAQKVLDACKERFGGEWKFLLRFHDNDKKLGTSRNKIKGKNVISVTSVADIQELLAFTDVAITDYSSWIYDFVLTRKPGFLFAMDEKKYNNERGFYFRLEESPFPVARTSEELVENILNFDETLYAQRVEEFLQGKGCMDDGGASRRIADQIMKWMDSDA